MDRNNNEDLTDDGPPITNEGTGKFAAGLVLTVAVVRSAGEVVQTPYHLWFWVNESRARPGQLIPRLYARCHYRGRVNLGGEVFDAVVYEYDRHNALFTENGIWIDLDRDGKLVDSEHFDDGDVVRVSDALVRVEFAGP